MRSGLQPVAIACNKNFYYEPFAALVDPRALSENGSDAPNVLRKPILCKKTNFAELAFSEVHRLRTSQIGARAVHDRTPSGWGRDRANPRATHLPTSSATLLGWPYRLTRESKTTPSRPGHGSVPS